MPPSSLFFRPTLIFAALLLGAWIALRDVPSAAESAHSVPPPALDTPANPQATSEVAILAGGCWRPAFPAVGLPASLSAAAARRRRTAARSWRGWLLQVRSWAALKPLSSQCLLAI